MPEHRLLNSQRNEVFVAIQSVGFDPAVFRWEKVRSQNTAGLDVPRLIHVPSGSFFVFDLINKTPCCQFSPGDHTYVEEAFHLGWYSLLQQVDTWLQYLKHEVESPDLWGAISGESTFVLGTSDTEAEKNTPFNSSERERISHNLNEIRSFLVSTQSLTKAQLDFIGKRLHYLEDAAGRMGRKDWITLAYGTLISIAIGAALAPDAAKELLRNAGSAFAWVLGGLPFLPNSAQ
jgi:hypothetical protein